MIAVRGEKAMERPTLMMRTEILDRRDRETSTRAAARRPTRCATASGNPDPTEGRPGSPATRRPVPAAVSLIPSRV